VSLTAVIVIYFFLPESQPEKVHEAADDHRWVQKMAGIEHEDCYDPDFFDLFAVIPFKRRNYLKPIVFSRSLIN
ncbi:MAG: hypothetical protein AAF840_14000, partial [Bacteroidota bacterium]